MTPEASLGVRRETARAQGDVRSLVSLFAVIATVIVLLAWILLQWRRAHVERDARATLLFIDRLKSEQLEIWQRQRVSDIAFVIQNPVNDEHLAPLLAGTATDADRHYARQWLQRILKDSFYSGVMLIDTQGEARLSVGTAATQLDADDRSNALRAVAGGRCGVGRIHAAAQTNVLHTILAVPVEVSASRRMIGAMLLEIDPADFLFPLLASWPKPSSSGETGLAQLEDGEAVVFSTRQYTNGPVKPLLMPLSLTNRPAVMAVSGVTGLVQGVDYRGEVVLAALRPVPESPWFLVTKIDRAEVLAPLREEAVVIAAGALILITISGLVLLIQQRKREAAFYRRELELDQLKQQQMEASLEQRRFFERIFEQTLAGHWDWFIPEGRLVMSARFKATLGYADDELPDTQEAWQRLVHPEDLPVLFAAYERHVASRGEVAYHLEIRYLHKDGSIVHVICAGLVIEWDEAGKPRRMVGCHTDLTETRRTEAALRASEKRLVDLIRHAPIPMAVSAKDGRILEFNESASRLFGYSHDDVATVEAWFARVYPDPSYRQEVLCAWQAASQAADDADGRIRPVEVRVTCRDGTVRVMEVSGVLGPENLLVMFVDVTDRHAAAAILRESEVRFHMLAEASFEGIVLSDRGRIVDCNRRFAEMFGGRHEDFIGRLITDFMVPDEAARIVAQLESPGISDIEGPAVRLDGVRICVEARGQHMERDGRMLRIDALRDVTERRRMENELRKLTRAVEQSPATVVITDIRGNIEYVNPQFTLSTGYTREEAIGQNPRVLKSGVHPESFYADLWFTIASGRVWRGEVCSRRKTGDLIWESVAITPIRNERDEITHYAAVKIDITARKQAEEALRKLSVAAEQSPAPVMITNTAGVIEYVSPSFTGLTGYREAEVVGHNTRLLKSGVHSREFYTELWNTILAGRVWHGDLCNRRKDGSLYWEHDAIAPLTDAQGTITHFVAVKSDITERRQIQLELQRAKDAAEFASRAKSDFLANMSHELRTPLNAVIGFSEILADQTFGPVNPKQARYVDNILHAGRHLLSLINDILDLSKVEAGRMKMERTNLPLRAVVEQVIELTRGRAMKHGLSIEHDVPDGLSVFVDERMLKQVLFNLVTNAAKFTPDGGRIRIGATRREDGVLVSVADTGIGIRPEDQERIFEQFEQVDSSLGRKQQGTGLGLTLCRRFVELHGGRIWVESEGENRGSTFHFLLPDAPARTENAS